MVQLLDHKYSTAPEFSDVGLLDAWGSDPFTNSITIRTPTVCDKFFVTSQKSNLNFKGTIE